MDLAAGTLLGSAHPPGRPAALAHDVSEPYNRGLQLLRQAAATVQRRVPEDTDGDDVMEDTDISQLTQAERDQLLSAASKGQDCKKLRRLLRNRVCAQQARERKKQEVSSLKGRVAEQEAYIAALQARLAKVEGDNATLRRLILTIRAPAGAAAAPQPMKAPPPPPAAAVAEPAGAAAGGAPAQRLLAQAEALLGRAPPAGPCNGSSGLRPDQAAEVARQQKRQRLMALAQQRVPQRPQLPGATPAAAGHVLHPVQAQQQQQQQQQQHGVSNKAGAPLSCLPMLPPLLPPGEVPQGALPLCPGAPKGPNALPGDRPFLSHPAMPAAVSMYGVVPSMMPSAATAAAGATAAGAGCGGMMDAGMRGVAPHPHTQQQQQQQQQLSEQGRLPSSGLAGPVPRPPGAHLHNPEVRRVAMLAMLAKQSCLALTQQQQQQQEGAGGGGDAQQQLTLAQPPRRGQHVQAGGSAGQQPLPGACVGPSPDSSGVALLPGGLQLPEGAVASQGLHMSALGPAKQVLQLQQMVDQELDALQGQLQQQLAQQQRDSSRRPSEQATATQVPPVSGGLNPAAQQHTAAAAQAEHPMVLLQCNTAEDTPMGRVATNMLVNTDASKLMELSSGNAGDGSMAMPGGVLGQEEQVAGVVPDVLGPLLPSRSSLGDIWAAMGSD